jgi:hypothetical protein
MSRGLKPDFLAALNAEAEASAYLRGRGKGHWCKLAERCERLG